MYHREFENDHVSDLLLGFYDSILIIQQINFSRINRVCDYLFYYKGYYCLDMDVNKLDSLWNTYQTPLYVH